MTESLKQQCSMEYGVDNKSFLLHIVFELLAPLWIGYAAAAFMPGVIQQINPCLSNLKLQILYH